MATTKKAFPSPHGDYFFELRSGCANNTMGIVSFRPLKGIIFLNG